jgi:hypothetical protein
MSKKQSTPDQPNIIPAPWLEELRAYMAASPPPQHVVVAFVPAGHTNDQGAPEINLMLCMRRGLGAEWAWVSLELPTVLQMIAAAIKSGAAIGLEQAPTPVGSPIGLLQ